MKGLDPLVVYASLNKKIKELAKEIESFKNAMEWIGVTTTALSDGSTANPIIINGKNVTAKDGNVAAYNGIEFIFNGTVWQEFGRDVSTLVTKAGLLQSTGQATDNTMSQKAITDALSSAGTVPDWNEWDYTADDYIKNRTHYHDEEYSSAPRLTAITEAASTEADVYIYNLKPYYKVYTVSSPDSDDLYLGTKNFVLPDLTIGSSDLYKVKIDSQEYKTHSIYNSQQSSTTFSVREMDLTDQGFIIVTMRSQSYGSSTVSSQTVIYAEEGMTSKAFEIYQIAYYDSKLLDNDYLDMDSAPTNNSGKPVKSGGVYNSLKDKQGKIAASGILKGDGNGNVIAATDGTDYISPDNLAQSTGQGTNVPMSQKAVTDALSSTGAVPNWNEWDYTAGDYIKNRTHYHDEEYESEPYITANTSAADTSSQSITYNGTSYYLVYTATALTNEKYLSGATYETGPQQTKSDNHYQVIVGSSEYIGTPTNLNPTPIQPQTYWHNALYMETLGLIADSTYNRYSSVDIDSTLKIYAVEGTPAQTINFYKIKYYDVKKLDNEYLNIDNVPASSSDNPLSSKGAYTAINGVKVKSGTISIASNAWSYISLGDYYQATATISGVTITTSSKVDLQPYITQIGTMKANGIEAIMIVNDNGTLRAQAICNDGAPGSTLTIPCTITEVG